ncbi:MAG TPA: radical SAM protein [Terriglobales bacterium]|nr:radical SAM protein [Terriglobales bacterium]
MASLPLLQPEDDCALVPALGPQLVGIARLAAAGESIREGHNVEYFTIETRSILNRCNVPRMPFAWTINPFRGCEFACKYCYARYTHEFMELRDPLLFERRIYVKQHVRSQLRRDLKRVKPGEEIAIGTATDPYQPAERRYEVTRSVLEEMANYRGLEIGIVTKSNLVLRDTMLLRRIAEDNQISVTLTITTLNASLSRLTEPRAPRPDLRLDAITALHRAGIRTGVSMAPILPGITDQPADIEALVRAARQAGASYIFGNPVFLKPCSAAVFLPFLEKEFPHLLENYRRRFADRAFLPNAYRKQIGQLMTRLRLKYGFTRMADRQRTYDRYALEAEGRDPRMKIEKQSDQDPQPEQLGLF